MAEGATGEAGIESIESCGVAPTKQRDDKGCDKRYKVDERVGETKAAATAAEAVKSMKFSSRLNHKLLDKLFESTEAKQ